MKRIFIKSALLTLSTLMLTTGCGDDFLDEPAPGNLAEEEFYKTDKDASQAVIGVYDATSAQYNTAWNSIYVIKTMLSDESNAGGSGPGDQPGYQAIDDFNVDPENDKVAGAWNTCYQAIYRANKVINRTQPETDLRKRLIAEAKVLRAFNYFDLVTLWGDVPLVTSDIEQNEYTSVGRTPKDSVYMLIEQDLREAIAELPLKSGYSAADRFRVSKGTAQALLGKALLYQEKWTEAYKQFDAVIESNEYRLEPSVAKVFSQAGEFGVESLFELSFTNAQNYDWGNFPWSSAPESNIHVQLMGPRSDYYTKAPEDSLTGGWGFNLPTDKLYKAYVAAGDVSRRKTTVMSEEELEAAGGKWSLPREESYDFEGYFQRKYGTFAKETGAPVNELNYGNNIRVLRYADVLLMAAESHLLAPDGDKTKALQYLNDVRQRPGTNLPVVSKSGTELFEAIVTERQLELAFEGVRFQDLVRWRLADEQLVSLDFVPGKHELLPIPGLDVRTGNLPQNNY